MTDTLSPFGDVIGQYAACRIDALWFFGLMCGIVVLLIVLSACGFWIVALFLCICFLRSVLWLIVFFSLCQRIFDCCLRSFALARATKGLCPLESRSLEKAGELFSFWCGSVGAVHLNIKSKSRTAKAVRSTNKNAKYPLRGCITISLNNSKATVCPNPTTLGISYRGKTVRTPHPPPKKKECFYEKN